MYDAVWDDVFRNQAWGKYPGEDLIRFVARNFYRAPNRQDVKILEVGCGPGANLWFLAREGFSFCGIDGSPTAISQAAARLDAEVGDWRGRGSLHVGDVTRLPFSDGQFDAVIDSECVSCNDWDSALQIYREMHRVIKVGGRVFSRTFASGSWGDGTGVSIGRNCWICDQGPLAEKGLARFTSIQDVGELMGPLRIDSIEKISRTENAGEHRIEELIVLATKV